MIVNAIEGVVENGRIRLRDDVSLRENTRVYVIVADSLSEAAAHLRTPRLAHPERARDFRKQVVEVSEND